MVRGELRIRERAGAVPFHELSVRYRGAGHQVRESVDLVRRGIPQCDPPADIGWIETRVGGFGTVEDLVEVEPHHKKDEHV